MGFIINDNLPTGFGFDITNSYLTTTYNGLTIRKKMDLTTTGDRQTVPGVYQIEWVTAWWKDKASKDAGEQPFKTQSYSIDWTPDVDEANPMKFAYNYMKNSYTSIVDVITQPVPAPTPVLTPLQQSMESPTDQMKEQIKLQHENRPVKEEPKYETKEKVEFKQFYKLPNSEIKVLHDKSKDNFKLPNTDIKVPSNLSKTDFIP